MSSDDALDLTGAGSLKLDELARRAEDLQSSESFRNRLIAVFESLQNASDSSPHVEEQIYDGFPSSSDQELMRTFHQVPWEERVELVRQLEDHRMQQLGRQLVYFERPDLLDERTRLELERTFVKRLMSTDTQPPWLTLSRAIQKLDNLAATSDAATRELLLLYRTYLERRTESRATMAASRAEF